MSQGVCARNAAGRLPLPAGGVPTSAPTRRGGRRRTDDGPCGAVGAGHPSRFTAEAATGLPGPVPRGHRRARPPSPARHGQGGDDDGQPGDHDRHHPSRRGSVDVDGDSIGVAGGSPHPAATAMHITRIAEVRRIMSDPSQLRCRSSVQFRRQRSAMPVPIVVSEPPSPQLLHGVGCCRKPHCGRTASEAWGHSEVR